MVTVFTPIYNRKYIIGNLYESLKKQINKNFEWIVVDDGSTDNVYELLCDWAAKEKDFKIRVYRVENGGKHRAINKGVKLAKGEAFFIVDSDDYLSEDAIDFIDDNFEQISRDDTFAGISGLRYNYTTKKCIGEKPKFVDYIDATNLERRNYGLGGDKAEVYKTDILKQYPFPEYDGENFITEEVVWNRIAHDGYKLRWFNKPIYYCEYLEDGLTSKGMGIFINNPKGWAKWLSDAEKNHYWDEQTIRNRLVAFVKNMYGKKNYKDIKEEFFFYETQLDSLEVQENNICLTIKHFLEEFNYQSIALYGYGVRGKRLERYLKLVNRKIEYAIDKNRIFSDSVTIKKLSEDLPNVDIVIITLKDNNLSECDINKLKYTSKKVSVLSEIVEEF